MIGPGLRRAATVAFLALVAVRFLSVDLFPVVTNDSLAYIGHSNDWSTYGLVNVGYRQFGYPMLLFGSDLLSRLAGPDPLLLQAVLQRLLLAGALAYAWWLWRWWAAPLRVVATTPSLVAYTNFMLTEGPAVGLVILYAVAVAHALRLASGAADERVQALPFGLLRGRPQAVYRVAAGVAAAAFLLLATLRLHYVLLAPGLGFVLLRAWFAPRIDRRLAVAGLVAVPLVLVAMAGGLSIENEREFGTFFPSTRSERNQYWAAWQVVFGLHPESREVAELADHFNDGDPYVRIRAIESAYPEYVDQRPEFEAAIDEMLVGAGLDTSRERIRAGAGAIRGGRFDDVRGIIRAGLDADYESVAAVININAFARSQGPDAFDDAYNDGREVGVVLVSQMFPRPFAPFFTDLLRWLGPASVLALLIGLAVPGTRWPAAAGLAGIGLSAATLGYLLMDNTRFIVIANLFALALASEAAAGAFGWLAERRAKADRRGAGGAG